LDHLGHPPSPLENSYIDRIGVMSERVHELEARILHGVDGPSDTRDLTLLVNSLHQLLQNLGWRSNGHNPVVDDSRGHYAFLSEGLDVA
jgi:hypothetical protein